jgi:hypothetical protein
MIAVLSLASCMSYQGQLDQQYDRIPVIDNLAPEEIAAKVKVSRDDFKKHTRLSTPEISVEGPGPANTYKIALHALREDGKAVSYYLQIKSVRTYSHSWAFWRSAADKNGKQFELVSASRDVGDGGTVYESSFAPLERDYLDMLAVDGAHWRAYGDRVQIEFLLSKNLAAGFLKRVDDELTKNPLR